MLDDEHGCLSAGRAPHLQTAFRVLRFGYTPPILQPGMLFITAHSFYISTLKPVKVSRLLGAACRLLLITRL